MTEDSVPVPPPAPEAQPGRVRVDAVPASRFDALPALYLLGFLVLGGALVYLYRHPAERAAAAQDTAQVDTLRMQVQALTERLARVESRPAPAIPAAPPAPNLAPLDARIAALETRPQPAPTPPADLAPLDRRIAGLEQRPVPAPVDLGPLNAGIAALTARQAAEAAAAASRTDAAAQKAAEAVQGVAARTTALDGRITAVEGQAKQTAAAVEAITARTRMAGRLAAAVTALNAGQKLGDIPGAPPAVARFATEAPPTEPALRSAFEASAAAASAASQPAGMDDKPFGARLWNRAQQVVTVRQGDNVLLGDPAAGVLARARAALDAGDLRSAVEALDALSGPAKAAMAGWTGQARALLDARAALAGMAAG